MACLVVAIQSQQFAAGIRYHAIKTSLCSHNALYLNVFWWTVAATGGTFSKIFSILRYRHGDD
jgi:hypothetical protein